MHFSPLILYIFLCYKYFQDCIIHGKCNILMDAAAIIAAKLFVVPGSRKYLTTFWNLFCKWSGSFKWPFYISIKSLITLVNKKIYFWNLSGGFKNNKWQQCIDIQNIHFSTKDSNTDSCKFFILICQVILLIEKNLCGR